MKTYKSDPYFSTHSATPVSRIFIILNDEERFNLAKTIHEIEAKVSSLEAEGKLKRYKTKYAKSKNPDVIAFNGKDAEAITFLKRMTWFTAFPESQAIDPTCQQLDTIVNTMLTKLYGEPTNLITLCGLKLEQALPISKREMKAHMDYKRQIIRDAIRDGLLHKYFPMPY